MSESVNLHHETLWSSEKLKELILYVALKCEDEASFGATKLNKILFYSDFRHYVREGRSITEDNYQKLVNGPAPYHLLPAQNELIEEKAAHPREMRFGGYLQKKLIALREPNIGLFSAAEISIVDEVIEESRGLTATQMSEASHQFLGWRLADIQEEIPYSIALINSEAELTGEQIELGLSLEAEAAALISS